MRVVSPPPSVAAQYPEQSTAPFSKEYSSVVSLVKTLNKSNDYTLQNNTMADITSLLYGPGCKFVAQQAFLHAGGPLAVVTAMEKHPADSLQLQNYGIQTLINCAHENTTLARVVAEIGGIEAVCRASMVYPQSRTLQRLALSFLAIITRLPANADFFVKHLDGIAFLIKIMERCSQRVNLRAIRFLALLCHDPTTVIHIKQINNSGEIIQVLRRLARHHEQDGNIQAHTDKIIAALTLKD